jgi:hypothetical protein
MCAKALWYEGDGMGVVWEKGSGARAQRGEC